MAVGYIMNGRAMLIDETDYKIMEARALFFWLISAQISAQNSIFFGCNF